MKKCVFLVCFLVVVAAANAQYYVNKAARFGQGSYYSSVNETSFDYTGPITIEAWVYLDSIALDMAIVGKTFQTGYQFGFRQNSPTDAILRLTVNDEFVNSTGTVGLNKWTHVAVTYDGVGTVQFFIDGVLTPNGTGSISGPIPTNNDDFLIGTDHYMGNLVCFMHGQIDEVHIWGDVLPEAQIWSHRYIPMGVDVSGSIYPMRESFRMNMPSATDTLHSDRWPHHALVPHNITIMDYSNKTSTYIDYNNHLKFDGASGMRVYTNLTFDDLIPGKSFTLEVWVRPDNTLPSPPTYMGVFNQSSGTADMPWGIYVEPSDGKVLFGKNGTGMLAGGNVFDGQWHHIAVTCNDNTGLIVLYIDGQLVVDGNFVPGTGSIQQSSTSWYIGSFGASDFSSYFFSGNIDEPRLWKNTVRTQQEIRKYMYTGLDDQINDPDINNLVVFNFDGTTRQSNKSILTEEPARYGDFIGNPTFTSSKTNDNTSPTSPLLRYDAYHYPEEFTMSDTPKNIVDEATVWDTVSITGVTGAASKVQVAVLLNHGYISDLEMMLYSPAGDSVLLTDANVTGCNGNDLMTIFTVDADLTYSVYCAQPIAPNITPSSPSIKPVGNLSAVMTGSPNGNWRLRVSDKSAGLDGYLHTWGVRVTGGASLPQQEALSFKTYNFPNPATNTTTIYFELPQPDDVKLTIYDQAGRMVRQQWIKNAVSGENYFEADLTSFATGIYYYELAAGNYRANGKMAISK